MIAALALAWTAGAQAAATPQEVERLGRDLTPVGAEKAANKDGSIPADNPTTFAGLAQGVAPGDHLLLADGYIELRVDSSDGSEIQTTVLQGGDLGEHKGINAPGVKLPTGALTENGGFAGWARPTGVLVAAVLAWRRAPFVVVVVGAAAVTAAATASR